MKQYIVKGNYSGLELNLGIIATLIDDLEVLKEEIKLQHNVSEVILEELHTTKKEFEECLPF